MNCHALLQAICISIYFSIQGELFIYIFQEPEGQAERNLKEETVSAFQLKEQSQTPGEELLIL